MFTYIKSRGFYAGLQLDGTIVIERTDENERFYGERIGVKDILAGKVRHPPYELKRLMETLKSAQGDTDVDESLIPDEASPADFEVTAPTTAEDKAFGIPAEDDPDPFGLLALQSAGLEIREAGTHARPSSEQFEFRPSPTSPIFSTFRKSTDRSSIAASLAPSRRSSWRTSTLSSVLGGSRPSSNYADSSTQTSYADSFTQTDLEPPTPITPAKKTPPQLPPRTPPRPTAARTPSPPMADIPETHVQEATPLKKVTPEPIERSMPSSPLRQSIEVDNEKTAELEKDTEKKIGNSEEKLDDPKEERNDSEDEEEEVVIHEVHQAAAPQVINRARIIQVAKPVAPMLPPRNPFRNSRNRNSTTSEASTERGAEEKPSPISTPSLRHGDSTSSSRASRATASHTSAPASSPSLFRHRTRTMTTSQTSTTISTRSPSRPSRRCRARFKQILPCTHLTISAHTTITY